jgi:hypothetical protein
MGTICVQGTRCKPGISITTFFPLGTDYSKFYLGAENLLNYRNVKLNSQACVNM